MKFKFPKQEEAVLVHLKFKLSIFEKIKAIAEREECLRAEAIMVLLEAAIEEYNRQTEGGIVESTAYPIPSDSENSPDEDFSKKKS